MKKLKIAVLTEIVNYHSGARAPLEIAKHLAKLGHNITVYGYDVSLEDYAKKNLEKNGVTIRIMKKRSIPFLGKYITALSLFSLLHTDSSDILLFAGTLPFFIAGKLTGIPIIQIYMGTQFNAFFENFLPNQKKSSITKIGNMLANTYIYLAGLIPFSLSNAVVAISKYTQSEGKLLYKRNPNEVIYLGSTTFEYQSRVRKKNSLSLLSVSRITPYKGFHYLIRALDKLHTHKKVILTIAGSNPKEKYLSYLKKLAGKNVTIIINPNDDILATLYRNCDIYVNADTYLYFGLPIFEAAQLAKPTVSLNYAAANEMIQHGKTGYVATTLDEFSLYLQKLIVDKTLRNKFGQNALKWSKEFSWEESARKWEKIIKKHAKK